MKSLLMTEKRMRCEVQGCLNLTESGREMPPLALETRRVLRDCREKREKGRKRHYSHITDRPSSAWRLLFRFTKSGCSSKQLQMETSSCLC